MTLWMILNPNKCRIIIEALLIHQ